MLFLVGGEEGGAMGGASWPRGGWGTNRGKVQILGPGPESAVRPEVWPGSLKVRPGSLKVWPGSLKVWPSRIYGASRKYGGSRGCTAAAGIPWLAL